MKADKGDIQGKAEFETLFTCYVLEHQLLLNFIHGESGVDFFIPTTGTISLPENFHMSDM